MVTESYQTYANGCYDMLLLTKSEECNTNLKYVCQNIGILMAKWCQVCPIILITVVVTWLETSYLTYKVLNVFDISCLMLDKLILYGKGYME